jgi:hypothetical protein
VFTPDAPPSAVDQTRSPFEQFAVPYQFQPRLTIAEALMSVFLALMRIFAGSILFAVWGEYSFLTWNNIGNGFGRGLVLMVLLAVFLITLGTMLIGVNALGRRLRRT